MSLPPLGLMPRTIWLESNVNPSMIDLLKRKQDIRGAMVRYLEVNKRIPRDWQKEMEHLEYILLQP